MIELLFWPCAVVTVYALTLYRLTHTPMRHYVSTLDDWPVMSVTPAVSVRVMNSYTTPTNQFVTPDWHTASTSDLLINRTETAVGSGMRGMARSGSAIAYQMYYEQQKNAYESHYQQAARAYDNAWTAEQQRQGVRD